MAKGPWHTLEPASRIRAGEVLRFPVAGRLLAVGRTREGDYFAVDDACPHAGGSLAEGLVEGEALICPIHGFAYHVREGRGLDDGAPLRTYPVRLREADDVLEIRIEG
ncbi:MAG: Rieske (2Fe-2S) protein [Myxococcota bacterium]|nr:Rieske (2Fe-2S) protein [Myxococcota bacterium]